MADAYESVVGGGLKLKGIEKKKKKKKRQTDEGAAEASAAAAAADAAAYAAFASSSSSDPLANVGHTDAERRRLETIAKRTVVKLEKGEVKSHRERVKDFNAYLGNLTEHYDLPKVSKGN